MRILPAYADHSGASGWFLANQDIEDAQPIIQIYRLECGDDVFSPSRVRGVRGNHLPPPDLEYELITLAHEYGHLMSFKGRTPRAEWDRYKAAASRRGEVVDGIRREMPPGVSPVDAMKRIRSALFAGLSDDQRSRIVAEEALAWQIGRVALEDLGLASFEAFDRHRNGGLHAHRYRLGMEDAPPDDDDVRIE